MTSFDKVAWLCSWLAPLGFGIALLAVLLSVALQPGAATELRALLPTTAVVGGLLGFVGQIVLTYHVAKASFLTSAERSVLLRALYLGTGYGLWRATMRGEVPS
jgi:hypothetical protein